MENKEELLTEEKILNASKKIFLEKGYHGARMQEIADEAGINKAMLHYYFRSKDKLFEQVFIGLFSKLVESVNISFSKSENFEEKIRHFFDKYIDFLVKNPFVPGFIINEIGRNSERIKFLIKDNKEAVFDSIIQIFQDAIDQGIIRKWDPRQYIMSMIGIAVYPLVAKPLLMKMFDVNESQFNEMMESRKTECAEMFLNGICIKNQE